MTIRLMRVLVLALVAFVALASHAAAGTPDAPELTDPSGDTAPTGFDSADLLSAWFTEGNFTVLVHLEVVDLREPVPWSRYVVNWHERDSRRGVTFDFDAQGRMSARYGLENGTETFGGRELEWDHTTDAPGLLVVQIPRRVVLANGGDAFANITAHAQAPRLDDGRVPFGGWTDEARTDAAFVLTRGYEPVYGSPGPVLGVALATILGAAAVLRAGARSGRAS